MNQKIDDLLLACEDSPMCMYAGAYIKSLEKQIEELKKEMSDNG